MDKSMLLESYAVLYYLRRTMIANRNTAHRRRLFRWFKPVLKFHVQTLEKRIAEMDKELSDLKAQILK